MTQLLVVTNQSEISEQLSNILGKAGFHILTATNADEASKSMQQALPGLILCNADDAEVGCVELLETLRQQVTTSTVPFIFLVTELTPAIRRRGMNLGADDYLVKPLDEQEVLDTINCRLTRSQKLEEYVSNKSEELRLNVTVALPHELRTPLQGIVTSAELLSEYWQTLDQDDIVEITQNISHSASRLNQLVQKFLIYFKLNLVASDPQECSDWGCSSSIQTSELLIESLAADIAQRYGREEHLRCELCQATVAISEKWLTILIEELVDNAFKFSQPEMLLGDSEQMVSIRSRVEGDRWVLQIEDQGRGMAQEQIENIGAYMQFNRLQYEQQGTGLGLAIAQRIVKIYNGTMTIDSTVNEGTSLTISLPLQDETKAEEHFLIG